jgi:Tfp pilus assembly protein PilN
MKAVNLLPPDLRGAGSPASAVSSAGDSVGRSGAFGVLGALGFCVVALVAYVLTTNTIKDRQAELDGVTAQAAAVTQRASQLKPYADFATTAAQRIATVRDLAAARFDWEQALRDISRAVPADVTLADLTGTVSNEAGGGSSVRTAIASPAVEITGCTSSQRGVATLLSRLRTVDGVTRVSLSKSSRPEEPAAGAATTTSAPTGCGGKGRPPEFGITLFFELDKTPATVQDVTVTTAAPAGGTTPAAGATATPTPTPAPTTTG